jgi:iron(III) transport system substrate-binding protein
MVVVSPSHRVKPNRAGTPSMPTRRHAGRRLLSAVAVALGVGVGGLGTTGCRPGAAPEQVVVYAAQDRMLAEPLLAAFTRDTGIEVRAVYDNEATKTTGMANRLLAERAHPQADVWWSNEEMRTRQLAAMGVLEPDWAVFGERRRVLVCRAEDRERLPQPPALALLLHPELRGRVALAYPLFGSTATHLMMLRQRWGDARWTDWCRAVMANRPMLVDGNSVVVRRVAAGDVVLGLTDTDDVEAARREGIGVVAIPLPESEDLVLPNSVALVRGAPHPGPARRLAGYLRSSAALDALVRAGAVSPVGTGGAGSATDAAWGGLLGDLDAVSRRMEELFRR